MMSYNLTKNKFFPLMPLVITLSLTVIVWQGFALAIGDETQKRFDIHTERVSQKISDRMNAYEQVLAGTKGLFAASQKVDRDEWNAFVDLQNLQERFPGIQALGYSQLVGGSKNLQSHIDEIRSQGFPDFTVHPMGDREEYHSIIYVSPHDERNKKAFGLDMTFEQNRRNAMIDARDSGETSITNKIILVQEIDDDIQNGFLMMMPVYKNGSPTGTVEERSNNLQGFVYAAFRMNDLMDGIQDFENSQITFDIYDGQINQDSLLYSESLSNAKEHEYEYELEKESSLFIGGKEWKLKYSPHQTFFNEFELIIPYIILGTGFAFSGFLFYTFRSFNSTRIRLSRLTEITNSMYQTEDRVKINSDLKNPKYEISRLSNAFEKMQARIASKNSQLKQNLKEMESINKGKEEFTAMISHELKTPITPIIMWADILKEPGMIGELNKEQLEAVEKISSCADQLNFLVSDMFDAYKLDLEKLTFNKEKFSVDDLMQNITKNYESIAEKRGVKIINNTLEILTITSDERRIYQVLKNLISNAIDFVPENTGEVKIEASDSADCIEFSVKDNGIGISKENQAELFKKFYQTDTSLTRDHGGSGLGLTICKGIVEGLGGKIWVESELGRGSAFYFTIPKNLQKEKIASQ